MEIITKKDISKVQDLFMGFQHAYVYGKGPTFQVKNAEPTTITCCINQTVNVVGHADLLVVNDIETFDTINLETLKYVKCILVPYHIHINSRPHTDITYKNVVNKIKSHFNGFFIVYNLENCFRKYDEFICLPSKVVYSSCHTACDFLFGFLQNIQSIDTYGFGKFAYEAYHKSFNKPDTDIYNKTRMNELVCNMNLISKFYNKTIIYN